ncbi:hypothetical protein WICPIJ_008452 [Wickerhamomyces pijperi]|uniref:Superkiller protein 3 n=1 Tax=Wickerhamomyces pijperi TaxID=599730 RepID=A0A9P8PZ95_WICPI|nr:hypothetical protein WICPIJ_008452 [Wickerhamomyces pijperi]
MSAKDLLKAARSALASGNAEYGLQLSQDCLKIDPKNYFGYVFSGKSYHMLNNLPDAVNAYNQAISLDRTNMTAWTGLMLVLKNASDYKSFFYYVTELIELLLQLQQPLADILNDIRAYLDKNNSAEVLEEYYRVLLPFNKLGLLIPGLLATPEKVITEYLSIILKRETTEVHKLVTRERMKSRNQNQGDAIAWGFYKDSQVPKLYEELINVVNDDKSRRSIEEKYVQYRVQVLKSAPSNLKMGFFESLREYVEGLVYIGHTSYYVWTLYFDYMDFDDIFNIHPETIKSFLKLFEGVPLAQVLHAFCSTDFSPYKIEEEDEDKNKDKNQEDKSSDAENDSELQDLQGLTDEAVQLTPEELLVLMMQGFESCKTSLFAHRVILSYYIYLKKYSDSLPVCESSVRLLASSYNSTGFRFPHSRRDILVDYGVVLTYHEAPKNFQRALEIYDTTLAEFPNNVKSNVGKGLILAERGDFLEAEKLLSDVVAQFPDDSEAVKELSWVYIQLGKCEKGREGLLKVLANVKGTTLYHMELKAQVNWQISQSYMKQQEPEVSKAYEHLVDSLRSSNRFAPSFASLGEIYLHNYNDAKRASKCFLKAFELDSSEVKSAWYLVSELTNNGEWEKADSFCNRVITSENAKRRLGNESWPYRVLGAAALERQDDADAVKWYQNAIRLDPSDVESWIGLGEAYVGCGRLEAASKVYKKALEIEPDHWTAQYLLGAVLSKLTEFDESVTILENVLAEHPEEESVISALYEALLDYANSCVSKGFYGKGINLAVKTVDFLKKGNVESLNLWKTLSDLIYIFLKIQSKFEEFPAVEIIELLNKSKVDIDIASLSSLIESDNILELAVRLLIYSNEAVIALDPKSRPLRSSSFFNLGLAELFSYLKSKNTQYRDNAITHLKESIKLQNNYAQPWIALGIASVTVNSKVAQHCFIKASSIDPRDISIWSNMALLYLRCDDSVLATEAYMRGQSLAPSESISWLGHALSLEAQGDFETASNLYTHAFILSNGSSPSTQLAYAMNICLKRIGKGDDVRNMDAVQELTTATAGMLQYLKHYPSDSVGLSITALILERLSDYKLGKKISEKLLQCLERAFEETEDEVYLNKFAAVKSQVARFELGLGNYQEAVDAAHESLELGADDKTTISSRTVLGLAYFFTQNFDEALNEFKQILTISEESKRLVVLIAQVLYVYDTEETKQAALDQLFNNIETHGSSLLVTLVIGAISVIEKLPDYMEVIASELEALKLSELIDDRFRSVPLLLSEIKSRIQQADQTNEHWQKTAFFFPGDVQVWKKLDDAITLQISKTGKGIAVADLSDSYARSGSLEDAQRSVFLTPWNIQSLDALAGCF